METPPKNLGVVTHNPQNVRLWQHCHHGYAECNCNQDNSYGIIISKLPLMYLTKSYVRTNVKSRNKKVCYKSYGLLNKAQEDCPMYMGQQLKRTTAY